MKKTPSLLLVLAFCAVSVSCLKPNHSIRVNNKFNKSLNVNVGADHFGLISPGGRSGYQSIPEGSSQISGDVIGSVNISGKGTHKWTLTITSAGSVSIAEDK